MGDSVADGMRPPLPRPMLLRPGVIPSGDGWAFELKYDGFRAIVSTEDGFQVRSRRAWNMTDRVPELRELPPGLVLDGELVAFNAAGAPHWPLVVERVLHGNTAIPVTFVAFDLLRVDGHDITCNPWSQRRTLLEGTWAERPCARLSDVYDDGHVLFDAVVEHGLEGIVAKRRSGIYRPGYRGWTKVKNLRYWRRDSEIEHMQRRRQRSVAAF
jgi:bifunctional non-homologous end joining protein LigD